MNQIWNHGAFASLLSSENSSGFSSVEIYISDNPRGFIKYMAGEEGGFPVKRGTVHPAAYHKHPKPQNVWFTLNRMGMKGNK